MSDFKVYDNVERKIVETKSGHRYLLDIVCLEKNEGKLDKYFAIGYETSTNKQYGWVELHGDDPIERFIAYVRTIDKIEKDEYVKEFENKHP
ncbi:hypothetical protein [Virgibacillus sp. Bac332]|uniref:hypothetical protein n=1 Tax=Virgibacillus sp. Bac332 TaxID=2419842 RepID=UPI000EF49361|nr:hypothetical protein [Virgibacillus sp. Bac332]